MPSLLTPGELSAAQWTYLMQVFQAEAGMTGASGPPGTTPGTRLTGIKYVGKAYALWTEQLPTIGVQLRSVKQTAGPSRRRWVQTTYDIIVGTQSTDESATARNGSNTKANLEDAMAQLVPFVNDGAGNGIEPVLMDPQYRLLGSTTINDIEQNNAQDSWVDEVNFEWDSTGGESGTNAQIFAYGIVTFSAKQYIAIF